MEVRDTNIDCETAVDEPIDRRQEILEIAAALLKKTGYDRVSMRQIAAGTGILSASLYHHLEPKRTRFIETHEQALSNNAAHI